MSSLHSRRAFLEGVAAVAATGAMVVRPALERGTVVTGSRPAVRTPVVTFHLDRPYLDLTGTSAPYVPPAGTRSGQPLAALSDEVFFSRFPY